MKKNKQSTHVQSINHQSINLLHPTTLSLFPHLGASFSPFPSFPPNHPNQLPRFAAFLAFIASSSFWTRRNGRICLPVITPPGFVVSARRGGLGVSLAFSLNDIESSRSSWIGAPLDGTRAPPPGSPKMEERGDTRPGDCGPLRIMLLTTFAAEPFAALAAVTSEFERR